MDVYILKRTDNEIIAHFDGAKGSWMKIWTMGWLKGTANNFVKSNRLDFSKEKTYKFDKENVQRTPKTFRSG